MSHFSALEFTLNPIYDIIYIGISRIKIMVARNIGFISFRFSGTDGVSLETMKWATIMENMGYQCFFMAGELDVAPRASFLEEKLAFNHPKIKSIYDECFSNINRPKGLSKSIHTERKIIKQSIHDFINTYKIDLLVPQNCLTIPLNIPLGIALTEVIAETGIPVVAHHHDFFWERKRFLNNCIQDYLNMCYPPNLGNIEHIVINTNAQAQLALRTGIAATLIPNVMNFELGAPAQDDYNADVRKALKIDENELFILQPTRVVQRKGIEHAIELVRLLKRKAVLVISHASGDEGYEYQNRVQNFASLLGIHAIFVDEIIRETRGTTPDGRKIYTLWDIYPHADLITYPSLIEGFGNAFLEALWFRKPILVNNYSIYTTDIKPKGFKVIEMDNFISSKTVEQVNEVLANPGLSSKMAKVNYEIALQHYSYQILKKQLSAVLSRFWGSVEKGSERVR